MLDKMRLNPCLVEASKTHQNKKIQMEKNSMGLTFYNTEGKIL